MVDADAVRTTGLDDERRDDFSGDCCAFGETMAVEPLGFKRGALLGALSWSTVFLQLLVSLLLPRQLVQMECASMKWAVKMEPNSER